MPLRAITRRELLELRRDRRAVFSAGFLAVLLVVALLTTWSEQRAAADSRAEAQRVTREQWERQDDKNPHSAAHFGTYAFKVPGPLGYLDPGVDPYLGVAVWVEAHRQNPSLYRPAQEHAGSLHFGALTPALVLQDLVPLLLLTLAAAAMAGARDNGILRQELAAGVSGRELFVGKLAAMASVLLPVLGPAAVVGTVLLYWSAPLEFRADTLARWGLWLGAHALYGVGLLMLGLLISARARSVRVAWLLAAGVWVSGTLILPRALGDLAESWYPVPTATALGAAIDRDMTDGVDGHDPRAARTLALQQEVLERYGVHRVEDLPINFTGFALQAGEEYGNRVLDRHHGALWEQYQRQDRLQRWASLILPVTALRCVSMALAGTDARAHHRFVAAVEEYRRTLNKQMNDALTYRSQGATAYIGDTALWASAPDFQHRPASLSVILREQAVNLVILAGWCALFSLAGMRAMATLRA